MAVGGVADAKAQEAFCFAPNAGCVVQRVFDQPGSDVTRSLLAAIPLPELDDGWFDR